jgi:hypothetical protein
MMQNELAFDCGTFEALQKRHHACEVVLFESLNNVLRFRQL